MRINVDIDDSLLAEAMKAGPSKTKKQAVEEGLRLLARKKAWRDVLALRGNVHWEGDLDAMRERDG